MVMKGAGSEGYLLSKSYSYYVFALLFLLYLFDCMDRLVVVALFPFLQRDWGLTDTLCGLLVSAVYWTIVLFSFPVSILIDRWSRRKSIGFMAILWSLATAACAFTKNFTQLFFARAAIGLGEAGYAPGGTALISALFPEKKRAMIVGIWNASIPFGSALGVVLGGYIAVHWGWRHAFGLLSGALQYGFLLVGGITAILFASSAIAVTQDVVHPGLRATSYSLCVISMNLLGSSLGPIFTGYLSDRYGIGTALTVVSFFPLVACVLFFIGSLYYERDLARVERIALSVEE